jgi:hypothetical protein
MCSPASEVCCRSEYEEAGYDIGAKDHQHPDVLPRGLVTKDVPKFVQIHSFIVPKKVTISENSVINNGRREHKSAVSQSFHQTFKFIDFNFLTVHILLVKYS